MIGAEILDFYPYAEAESGSVRVPTGQAYGCDLWSETILVGSAEIVATFERGPMAGEPAILRHRYGDGEVFYVGTRLDEAGMAWLLDVASARAGISVPHRFPTGVEAVRRVGPGARFVFLLNHTDHAVELKLEVPGIDLLSGLKTTDRLKLLPRDVAVVREDKAPGWR